MAPTDTFLKAWEKPFLTYRPMLMSYVFRMTGSLAEAEDIVQDVFLECANVDLSKIENPKAWLMKVTSNKGLDHLKSAPKKREEYYGVWLPDAIPDAFQFWGGYENSSPDNALLISQSLTTSFLLLLEKLSPEERVVFLLGEIFEYSFKEIAELLDKSEAACRKTAERARKKVSDQKIRSAEISPKAEKLIADFFEAMKLGDPSALTPFLAEDSEFWSDGGGKVPAAPMVFKDRGAIARFFAGLAKAPFLQNVIFKTEVSTVNAMPGAVISKQLPSGEWVFETIFSFEIENGKLVRIFAQRNPDKLRALTGRLS